MVPAAIMAAALERDQIGRGRDHADRLGVAARVVAHRARIGFGDVHALRAQPRLLDQLDQRLCERADLVVRRADEMEREPRGGLLADAGQARQLADEPLDRIGHL